jgi:hypothetical protein
MAKLVVVNKKELAFAQQTPLEDVFESTVLQYVQHLRVNVELNIFIFRAT